MLTATEIKQRLKQSNLMQVSRDTGLNYMTIYHIANKEGNNMQLSKAEMLSDYFEKMDKVEEYKKKLIG